LHFLEHFQTHNKGFCQPSLIALWDYHRYPIQKRVKHWGNVFTMIVAENVPVDVLLQIFRRNAVMYTAAPAVEVLSPTDKPRDVSAKIVNYLAAGITVWPVDPIEREAAPPSPCPRCRRR